jgi:hypothetical protein
VKNTYPPGLFEMALFLWTRTVTSAAVEKSAKKAEVQMYNPLPAHPPLASAKTGFCVF